MQLILNFLKKYNNINWALADQSLVSGTNFIVGLLLARFLGIDSFGVFTLLWLSVLFVNSIQLALISSPMLSLAPLKKGKIKESFYTASLMMQILFSAISFVSLYGFVSVFVFYGHYTEFNELPLVFSTAATLFQFQDYLRRYYFSLHKFKSAFKLDFIYYVLQLCLILYFINTTDLSLEVIFSIISLSALIAIIVGIKELHVVYVRPKRLFKLIYKNWLYSRWLVYSSLMQWCSGNMIYIVAGAVLGTFSVGAIKACHNIVGISHIVYQGLENILPSRLGLQYKDGGIAAIKKTIVH